MHIVRWMKSGSRIIGAITVVLLSLPSASVGQSSEAVVTVAGAQYSAGALHRLILGEHYRELWTTPIQVSVLDLSTFAGGLVPIRRGGGMQTKSLRFMAGNGREYSFRSVDKDPSPVLDSLRSYEEAWGRRDAEALANLFTSDGFVLRPGHPPSHGRQAILAAYASSGGSLTLRPYSYAVDGTVAYIVGGYTSDPARKESGKFVLALRRSASGAWLIAADIDNGN
jgi:ketosteroid isomerase-like protein